MGSFPSTSKNERKQGERLERLGLAIRAQDRERIDKAFQAVDSVNLAFIKSIVRLKLSPSDIENLKIRLKEDINATDENGLTALDMVVQEIQRNHKKILREGTEV
jgi:hypothetical protein